MTMEDRVKALGDNFDRFTEFMTETIAELKASNRMNEQRLNDHQQMMAAFLEMQMDHKRVHEKWGRELQQNRVVMLKIAERLGLLDDDAFKC